MSRPSSWRWRLMVLGLAFLILAVASRCLSGCAVARPRLASPPPIAAPAGIAQDHPRLISAAAALVEKDQARVDDLQRQLAGALADRDSARAADSRDRLDGLRRIAWWVAGVATLGLFASAVVAVILPIGRRLALSAGAACGLVVALALGFDRLLPWLPALGIAIVGLGLAYGVWLVVRLLRAGRSAAAHGDRLEQAVLDWVPGEDAAALLAATKSVSAAEQDRLGVRQIIAALRGKLVAT